MRARFICLVFSTWILLLAGFIAAAPAHAGASPASTPMIIPGEVVIGTKTGFFAHSLRLPQGASVGPDSPELASLHAAVIRVPSGEENTYAQQLHDTPGVQFAEPNYLVTTEDSPVTPDDPLWPQQYGPAHIQAPEAWSVTTGSSRVILAVIDSGIDSNHPEFTGRILPGYDFVDGDTTPQDDCGHGTHVAGIAAAKGNNGQGIAGMAWNVEIMPVRVLDGYCGGSIVNVAEALVWAVERGARVINLSLGISTPSTLLEDGTYYAYTHGAAIFAAAGNTGSSPVVYPAAYPWVMAVGATDENDQRASYSNTGAGLDLMAPGTDILSTTPLGSFYYHYTDGVTQKYGTLSGTSMAAAHASGAAALLASLPQFDTPDKIYQALTSTAMDLDIPGRDDDTGYGLIQTDQALNFTPTIQPTPTPLPPATSYDILNSIFCGNQISYQWQDATRGSYLPVFGNDGYATVSLPFAFQFGDQTYDTVTVSANGYLTFGGDGSINENFIIPSIGQPQNFIAPFFTDLNPSAGGYLYQETLGKAPHRRYILEWDHVPIAGNDIAYSSLTFEVIFYEGSNNILFQYQTLIGKGADGSGATIGVQYDDGRSGREYSYDEAGAVSPGQALLFVPYATGTTPPSNNCSTYTRTVDSGGGFFDSYPFCVEIPAGALQAPATLQIQNLSSAPDMTGGWTSLNRYADIRLSLTPPLPLSPFPEAYVCYHYTTADVLEAGGHPENLFLATYDSLQQAWSLLPTTADTPQQLLIARAPHFSFYTVVTTLAPAQLPVTGSPFAPDPLTVLAALGILGALILLITWLRRRKAA